MYTPRDGKILEHFLKHTGFPRAKLIGSLGRGKNSKHDIDVLIPNEGSKYKFVGKLKKLLKARSYEYTDWGGIYFKNTVFGDVDVFFTTKDFDYL